MTINITVLLVVLVALTSTTVARLQGHNNHRTSNTNTYSSDKNIQQQQRQRELNEEENDKILVAMEKEYREDEASKQKAYEKANASHNKIVPDTELLQEIQSLDKESAKKEEFHQAQAHAEKKEKDQAEATVVDGLESIVKMKKEFKDYLDVQKKKKKIAADDNKIIQQVNKAHLASDKENKEMAAQAHAHQHENDQLALVYHEISILELQMIEQQAQDEALNEQLAEEAILHKEYDTQHQQHIRTMELLKA